MDKDLRLCEDGSHTLFSEKVGECYHSTHGALTESLHIFINYGFRVVIANRKERLSNQIRILEVGLGTGLNAMLTALEIQNENITVSYLGLEPYPIDPLVLKQLNYCTLLSGRSNTIFDLIHSGDWNVEQRLAPGFDFCKKKIGFMEAELPVNNFNLIYFDAFSPEAQPELWEPDVFEKCFDVMAADGMLVTYCAKGKVKRALKSAGFTVENLPGPPGKREITRAHKLI